MKSRVEPRITEDAEIIINLTHYIIRFLYAIWRGSRIKIGMTVLKVVHDGFESCALLPKLEWRDLRIKEKDDLLHEELSRLIPNKAAPLS